MSICFLTLLAIKKDRSGMKVLNESQIYMQTTNSGKNFDFEMGTLNAVECIN